MPQSCCRNILVKISDQTSGQSKKNFGWKNLVSIVGTYVLNKYDAKTTARNLSLKQSEAWKC